MEFSMNFYELMIVVKSCSTPIFPCMFIRVSSPINLFMAFFTMVIPSQIITEGKFNMEPQTWCLGDHFIHYFRISFYYCIWLCLRFHGGFVRVYSLHSSRILRNCLCFHHHKLTHFILEEIVIVTPFILYHIAI